MRGGKTARSTRCAVCLKGTTTHEVPLLATAETTTVKTLLGGAPSPNMPAPEAAVAPGQDPRLPTAPGRRRHRGAPRRGTRKSGLKGPRRVAQMLREKVAESGRGRGRRTSLFHPHHHRKIGRLSKKRGPPRRTRSLAPSTPGPTRGEGLIGGRGRSCPYGAPTRSTLHMMSPPQRGLAGGRGGSCPFGSPPRRTPHMTGPPPGRLGTRNGPRYDPRTLPRFSPPHLPIGS